MVARVRQISRNLLVGCGLWAMAGSAAAAQEALVGFGGEIRVLDKLTGNVQDVYLLPEGTAQIGFLGIELTECRYPASNPSGDAYIFLKLTYRDTDEPLFNGWMIASAPALNALDHPRYDVWALRCITS